MDQLFWLFRCTENQYANSFCKEGTIKLNAPKYWIDLEKEEGKGRGDVLEGVYASFSFLDTDNILYYRNFRNNVSGHTVDNVTYLRSNDVLELPSFCLYGIYDQSFQMRYFPETQKWAKVTYVTRDYFRDFSKYETRAEIELLSEEKRPVLVIIQSPNKFFERIYNYFEKIGISRNEVLVQPVKYMDKSTPFIVKDIFPSELFLKDKSFQHQSELRIVIKTKNVKALKKLRDTNYIINIGNLTDITEVYSYYLDDMLIELDGMTLRYNLPEPIITSFENMSKEQLLSLAIGLQNSSNEVISAEEISAALESIDKILKQKYNIYSYYLE
jgi:hypothetical protein